MWQSNAQTMLLAIHRETVKQSILIPLHPLSCPFRLSSTLIICLGFKEKDSVHVFNKGHSVLLLLTTKNLL